MSKITDDGLTQSGTRFFIAVYPYGNNGRQRINHLHHLVTPSTPPIQCCRFNVLHINVARVDSIIIYPLSS